MLPFVPATEPTLYFIGVATAKSSNMSVFPAWAQYLGMGNAVIKGIDLPLHAEPALYREAGAVHLRRSLVARRTPHPHKIDLSKSCADLFDEIDPHARLMEETSCISKASGKFVCHAKDPISSSLALDGFLPQGHFATGDAELFSIGAGGSTIALTWHLMQKARGADQPSRIIISDRNQHRLDDLCGIHRLMTCNLPVKYVLAPLTVDNDAIMAGLKLGSLVINATGLGKYAPDSPISDAAIFPERGIVWDLNYRGDLVFSTRCAPNGTPATCRSKMAGPR